MTNEELIDVLADRSKKIQPRLKVSSNIYKKAADGVLRTKDLLDLEIRMEEDLACLRKQIQRVESIERVVKRLPSYESDMKDEDWIKLIKEKKRRIDSKSKKELATAILFDIVGGNENNKLQLIRENLQSFIKDYGFDINHRNKGGDTLLSLVVKRTNSPEVLLLIIDQAPQLLDIRDDDGLLPLEAAIKRREVNIVKLLIENGALVNSVNPKNGDCPLHIAARNDNKVTFGYGHERELRYVFCPETENGNIEIMRELIKRGADIRCTNFNNETALSIAKVLGNEKMAKSLESECGIEEPPVTWLSAVVKILPAACESFLRSWINLDAELNTNRKRSIDL